MLLEYAFHLIVEMHIWITLLVLQLHLDIESELIEFGEHCYQRNLKNIPASNPSKHGSI
jgi:hypothetical protein